jgi:hypothetical protein
MKSLFTVSTFLYGFLFQALMGGYRPIPYIPDIAKLNEAEKKRNVIAQLADMKRFCADAIGKPAHDYKNGMEVVKYFANANYISNPMPEEKQKAITEKAKATRQSNNSRKFELSQNQATNSSQDKDVHSYVSSELQKLHEAKKKKKNKKKQTGDPSSIIKDEVQHDETNKQHCDNSRENAYEVLNFLKKINLFSF